MARIFDTPAAGLAGLARPVDQTSHRPARYYPELGEIAGCQAATPSLSPRSEKSEE
jgi:hypothetical protein